MTKLQLGLAVTTIALLAMLAVRAWTGVPQPPLEPTEVAASPKGVSGRLQREPRSEPRAAAPAAEHQVGPAVPETSGDHEHDDVGARAAVIAGNPSSTGSRANVAKPPNDTGAGRLQIDSRVAGAPAAVGLTEAQELARREINAAAAAAPPLPTVAGPAAVTADDAPEALYDSGEDALFRSDDQVEVQRPGKIEGPTGALSFDIKPQWDADTGYADFVSLGDNVKVTKLGNLLQFEIIDAGDVRHVVTAKVDQWEPEQAQKITATWDQKQLYLYVNDGLVAADGIEHPIQIAEDAVLRIGSRYSDGRPIAPATISRIRLQSDLYVPPPPEEAKP